MEPRAHLGFRVVNVSNDVADIDIFDVIGDPFFGTTASDFIKELRAITAPRINLHINSPGGYVSDGLAMFNAVQQHPAEVTALIESEAASAASFVAMAADKIAIARTAQMFIHDAQGFAVGNAADMKHLADILEEESQNIASIYAERCGGDATDWRNRMQANDGIGTSYRGQEAVDIGLVDEVMSMPKKKMPMSNAQPMRAVAISPEDPEVDPELFKQFTAQGYEPPMPADISRLIERNLATAKGG